jgi:type VI secretion system protein ImpA
VRQIFAEKLRSDPDPVEAVPAEALVAEVTTAGSTEPGGTRSASTSSGSSSPPVSGGVSPTPTTPDDAAARIGAIARYLRAEAPTNPAPYMMLRGFRWGELRAGGGRLDPRLLLAPPTEVRVRLKTLLLDARWSELLEAAEEVMATPWGRGWLDLQRNALTACENLGSEYEPVAAGIRASLRALLEALPELPAVTLMDDSPTANAETLRWLSAEGFLSDSTGVPVSPNGAVFASAAGRDRDHRARARDLARSASPGKAIEYLMREAAQAQSARARFLRRVEAAGIMVDEGLDAVALPILRELADQVDQFNLVDWESGELVAEPLGLLHRSLKRAGEDPSRCEELYLRICRLDPIYAMTLNEAGGAPEPAADSGSGW